MNTEEIAGFVAGTSYDQIPHEALVRAKWCILDCLGVALAGANESAGIIISEYVKDLGGKPEATVIASGFRTSSPQAALANGTLAHALDYDDSHPNFQHATAVTLPAVLALAECGRESGKAILEAYILGCEVGSKIGITMGNALGERGWHPCGIIGSIASAVASSKLLKLNNTQIKSALGITASQAAGLGRNIGTDVKPFHSGIGAKNGVVAAMLAARNFKADENIFEGHHSFPKVFLGNEYDLAKSSRQLGAPFSIVAQGIGRIKPYPTGGPSHKSVTAILELIQKQRIRAEEVAEVECQVSSYLVQHFGHYSRPRTASEARFSIHYAMAAALIDGALTLKQFTDEKVTTPEVQDLMSKVKLVELDSETKEGQTHSDPPQNVTVKLQNGKAYSHQVPFAKGEPRNPMSLEEIIGKFQDCAGTVLSPLDVERTVDLVLKLETLPDITGLMEFMRKTGSLKR
jgi:2-methylcitrate dehydratase PrpD